MSKNAETVKVIRACLPDGASSSIPWQSEIVEDITAAYLLQVQSLLETARQMDSVFMKRSKGAVASAPKTGVASLSDSEKIALQMVLDINAFEIEIKGVDIEDPYQIISFSALHNQIADMKKHFPNLSS